MLLDINFSWICKQFQNVLERGLIFSLRYLGYTVTELLMIMTVTDPCSS